MGHRQQIGTGTEAPDGDDDRCQPADRASLGHAPPEPDHQDDDQEQRGNSQASNPAAFTLRG